MGGGDVRGRELERFVGKKEEEREGFLGNFSLDCLRFLKFFNFSLFDGGRRNLMEEDCLKFYTYFHNTLFHNIRSEKKKKNWL